MRGCSRLDFILTVSSVNMMMQEQLVSSLQQVHVRELDMLECEEWVLLNDDRAIHSRRQHIEQDSPLMRECAGQ